MAVLAKNPEPEIGEVRTSTDWCWVALNSARSTLLPPHSTLPPSISVPRGWYWESWNFLEGLSLYWNSVTCTVTAKHFRESPFTFFSFCVRVCLLGSAKKKGEKLDTPSDEQVASPLSTRFVTFFEAKWETDTTTSSNSSLLATLRQESLAFFIVSSTINVRQTYSPI